MRARTLSIIVLIHFSVMGICQNVGVGITNPAGKLHIKTTEVLQDNVRLDALFPKLSFYNGPTLYGGLVGSSSNMTLNSINSVRLSTNSTIRMVIDQNGKIGLNTNTPSARLQIREDAEGLRFDGDNTWMSFWDGDTYKSYIYHSSAGNLDIVNRLSGKLRLGASNAMALTILANNRIAIGTNVDQTQSKLGVATANPFVAEFSSTTSSSTIAFGNTNNNVQKWCHLVTGTGGNFNIYTGSAVRNGVGTNAMTILGANQRVGIGTTNPLASLHVRNNLGNDTGMRIQGEDRATIQFEVPNETTVDGLVRYDGPTSSLRLMNRLNGSLFMGTNETIAFAIDGGGKVGIGTGEGTVGAKLHVKENSEAIRIDGDNSWISFYNGTDYQGYLWMSAGGTMVLRNQVANGNLGLGTNNTDNILIDGQGNVVATASRIVYGLATNQLGTCNPSGTFATFGNVQTCPGNGAFTCRASSNGNGQNYCCTPIDSGKSTSP